MQDEVRSQENPLGAERVIAPKGALPQGAHRLDASLPLYADETLIDVERLNLDSVSFRQLKENQEEGATPIADQILGIVRERGKMQNPVTGSGGMLLGKVMQVGPKAPPRFEVGDRVATLVSLTLTPLHLEEILSLHPSDPQVEVRGHAILFASSPAVKLPTDLPEAIALSILDVCGAPAWVRRLTKVGDKVLIVGAGKSGALAAAAASEKIVAEDLWISDISEASLEKTLSLGFAKNAVCANAQWPFEFHESFERAGAPRFDLVVNVSNAPETETASILVAKDGGKVLFFNMATQFSRAVLSTEGLGRDVELVMGNGFAQGHAEYTLDLVRRNNRLIKFFEV
ncbi:MAG: L-erythro-3,5-diaminohexanoate dehydrogenase [Deltaproteobacteria bacterium]|nr:L-erythro-3,5-diaminohexanoate dehydrogenase [Deltaproteobacteria bacterium]